MSRLSRCQAQSEIIKMSYKESIRKKAYEYYVTGIPITAVARKVKVSRNTIMAWRAKYNWQDRKAIVIERTGQILDQKLAEFKAEQVEDAREVLRDYFKQLRAGKITHKDTDFVAISRHIAWLMGESDSKTDITVEDKNVTELLAWMKATFKPYQNQ